MDGANQKLILKNTYKITSADADLHARIRLGSCVNLLVQSAVNSAEELGFGFGKMAKHNLFWVLSRLTLELYKPIYWCDNIEVETWPKTIDRLLYVRDFIMRDTNNEIVAKATSAWLAVDLKSKRPKNLDDEYLELFTALKDKHAIKNMPDKLSPVPGGEKTIINPSYFDYDLNKHVTATKYIDWMMDSFSFEHHKNNNPRKLTINYLKETLPEESIELVRKNNNDNNFLFEGTNLRSNLPAFRGEIQF